MELSESCIWAPNPASCGLSAPARTSPPAPASLKAVVLHFLLEPTFKVLTPSQHTAWVHSTERKKQQGRTRWCHLDYWDPRRSLVGGAQAGEDGEGRESQDQGPLQRGPAHPISQSLSPRRCPSGQDTHTGAGPGPRGTTQRDPRSKVRRGE